MGSIASDRIWVDNEKSLSEELKIYFKKRNKEFRKLKLTNKKLAEALKTAINRLEESESGDLKQVLAKAKATE